MANLYPASYPTDPHHRCDPVMEGVPMAAVSLAGSCPSTREELNEHLRESQYGAVSAIFCCYFVRDSPEGPVLCAACRMPIGLHQQRTSDPVASAAALDAPPAAAAAPAADKPKPDEALPAGVSKANGFDTYSFADEWGSLKIGFAVPCFIGVYGSAMGLGVSGMFNYNPALAVIPVLLAIIGVSLILSQQTTVVRFYKEGAASRVEVESYRQFNCCCPNSQVFSLNMVLETMRLQPGCCSTHVVGGSGYDTLVLFSGTAVYAENEMNVWRKYFESFLRAAPPAAATTTNILDAPAFIVVHSACS